MQCTLHDEQRLQLVEESTLTCLFDIEFMMYGIEDQVVLYEDICCTFDAVHRYLEATT